MADNTLWADGLVLPTPTLVSGEGLVANLTAPAPTTSTTTIDAILTAPAATLTSNFGLGSELRAPTPILASSFGDMAILSAPATTLSAGTNGATLSAPHGTLASDFGNMTVLTAPAPTLTSTCVVSWPMHLDMPIPAPLLVASGVCGEVLTFVNSAPVPTMDLGVTQCDNAIPAPVLAAAVLSGVLITVAAASPAPVLVAALTNPAIITSANSAAAPQLAAALVAGNIASAVLAAMPPQLTATALAGNVATALLTAATPIMAAAGFPAYTITFAGSAPAPYLDSSLGVVLAETYRTWVLNTRKGPLTEYNNFPFNSYAIFNGKVIAAGASGVVELGTQANDAGTAISSRITTGQESFASSLHKRVPRIYTSYSADGDMLFSTITTEGGTRTYALAWNHSTDIHQRRVPVGKGPKSRFWQFSIANVNGADFALNDILVLPTKLRRRVM